jgi:hypothetical protein
MLIRLKETGQVIDMIPAAALAKLQAGMAEPVQEKRETATVPSRWFERAAKFIGAR